MMEVTSNPHNDRLDKALKVSQSDHQSRYKIPTPITEGIQMVVEKA
jgi:hypothetical protein